MFNRAFSFGLVIGLALTACSSSEETTQRSLREESDNPSGTAASNSSSNASTEPTRSPYGHKPWGNGSR